MEQYKQFASRFNYSKYPTSYVVVDLETTGLNTSACEIIEIAGVKVVDGKVIDDFSRLIKPKKPIPSDASKINHITNKMVANCQSFSEVATEFLDFIQDYPLLGHNAYRYDELVLGNQLSRYGFDVELEWWDTLEFAKRLLVPPYKLTDLAHRLAVKPHGEAHRALADCYMTHGVYQEMLSRAYSLTVVENCIMKYTHQAVLGNELDGMVIRLTGEPESTGKSKFLKILVEHGACLSQSVTLKTTHLVACKGASESNIKKAKEYQERTGIQIVTESYIMDLIGRNKNNPKRSCKNQKPNIEISVNAPEPRSSKANSSNNRRKYRSSIKLILLSLLSVAFLMTVICLESINEKLVGVVFTAICIYFTLKEFQKPKVQ